MRLAISGGGTGGHVYPALAVVQKLEQLAKIDILWVGTDTGMEQALVKRADLTFEAISAVGIRGKNPLAMMGGLWTLGQGYRQSRRIIHQFQPHLLLVTGGYVCVPTALAAYQANIPIIIYLPDIKPGFAINFLARLAHTVAVTAPTSQQYFRPGLAIVTGYPVRAELFSSGDKESERTKVCHQLGMCEELPILLIFGGSRGARSINRAITDQLEAYLEICQIIHISGHLDEEWVQAKRDALPPRLQKRYYVSNYLHEEMVTAMKGADLVVSRAGASILGEFPAAGLPSILVPYPYAGAHQYANARYLAQHQAAIIVDDGELKEKLKNNVINLLTNRKMLETMRQSSLALAKPDAAISLAQKILEVGNYVAN